MDAGEEKIEDQIMVDGLRAKAKRVNRRALVTAVIITLVVLLFPTRLT